MQYEKSDIEQLVFQRISGTISKGDDQLLSGVLELDEQMRFFYESVIANLPSEKDPDFLSKIDQDKAWNNILSKIKPVKRSNPFSKYLPYAAILILGVLLSFYYWQSKKTVVKEARIKSYQVNPKIQLILSSGKTINLTQQNNILKTNLVELSTSKTGLTYQSKADQAETEFNTLTIPDTYIYHIALSDGTLVWLNSHSQLRFPFTFGSKKREVYVSGEAYFKVAKNARKPFVVHTPETDVIVKGTSFNVNTYKAGKIITSLIEGKVETKDQNKNSINLTPGKEAVYTAGNFVLKSFDKDNLTAWMDGRYYFHDCSLNDLAFAIKRWYNIDMVFQSSKTSSHRMSGIIEKNQSISQFIDNLTASTQLHVEVKNQKLYIY